MINPMIGMPQGAEWLVILAIVILVFGAAKLPDLARGTGQALRIFKSETKGLKDDESRTAPPEPRAELPATTDEAPTTRTARPTPTTADRGRSLTTRVDLRGRQALHWPTRSPGRPRRPDGAL